MAEGEKKSRSAKEKAARYCSIEERSQYQVRNKLSDYGVFGEEAEDIIAELISLNFINEERFAQAYARGKFRIKSWGRIKIMQGLKMHQISEYCIKKAFEEITDEDYLKTASFLLEKYIRTLKEQNPYLRKQKSIRFLIQKGYEPSEVYNLIEDHFS